MKIDVTKQLFDQIKTTATFFDECNENCVLKRKLVQATPSGDPYLAVHPHHRNVAIGAGFSGWLNFALMIIIDEEHVLIWLYTSMQKYRS